MVVALLFTIALGAGQQPPAAAAQLDPKLIRVHVRTDDGGNADELAARRDSVNHLRSALAGKKKADIVVADNEDSADVVVDVEGRGITVPKVVIGLSGGMGSPNGRPGASSAPIRAVKLDVTIAIAREMDATELTNKNRANESEPGWKSAADDVAKQVEKWVADHRAAIVEARRRRF